MTGYIILGVVVTIFILAIRIVPQHRRAIVERFGKYNRYFEPGFKLIIPIIETCKSRDIRSHTLDIEPQPVITKDNVEIKVDGIIWAKPYANEVNIKSTFYSIDDWKDAIQQLAQTNLRQEFGALTLDDSLVARAKISENLETALDKITDEKVHLAQDRGFFYLNQISYGGGSENTKIAVAFQREIINNIIPRVVQKVYIKIILFDLPIIDVFKSKRCLS